MFRADLLAEEEAEQLMPTAQIAAPMTLAVEERALRHPLAPASIGTIVRTNGMKRASTTARGAAPLEELVRPLEILGLEEPGVGLEQPRAVTLGRSSSRPARRATAATNDADDDDAEVEVRVVAAGLGRGEEPGDEQERVAGERRRERCPDSTKMTRIRPIVPKVSIRSLGSSQFRAASIGGHARRSPT